MSVRILLIMPDAGPKSLIASSLRQAGEFLVREEPTGELGLACAFEWGPNAAIVGHDLRGIGGLEVTRLLKGDPRTRHIPIVAVSENAGESEVIEALRAGADEHVSLPCSPEQIFWRVRALLRRFERSGAVPMETLLAGPILLDLQERAAYVSGREVRLRKREFDLLEAFLRKPGRALTRRFLLESIWGFDSAASTRAVDIHVARLRRKLGPPARRLILTVHGLGYKLRQERLAGFRDF